MQEIWSETDSWTCHVAASRTSAKHVVLISAWYVQSLKLKTEREPLQEKKNLRDDEMFFAMLCALADLGDVEGAAQLVQLMLEENQERSKHSSSNLGC